MVDKSGVVRVREGDDDKKNPVEEGLVLFMFVGTQKSISHTQVLLECHLSGPSRRWSSLDWAGLWPSGEWAGLLLLPPHYRKLWGRLWVGGQGRELRPIHSF